MEESITHMAVWEQIKDLLETSQTPPDDWYFDDEEIYDKVEKIANQIEKLASEVEDDMRRMT